MKPILGQTFHSLSCHDSFLMFGRPKFDSEVSMTTRKSVCVRVLVSVWVCACVRERERVRIRGKQQFLATNRVSRRLHDLMSFNSWSYCMMHYPLGSTAVDTFIWKILKSKIILRRQFKNLSSHLKNQLFYPRHLVRFRNKKRFGLVRLVQSRYKTV